MTELLNQKKKMTKLLLHINNYFITEVIIAYQTYPQLGVSNQTHQPTHPPNQTDPAQEPADLTPAMVSDRSPLPKPEISGSVDKLELGKPIFNRPNRKTHQKQLSPSIEVVCLSILSNLSLRGQEPLAKGGKNQEDYESSLI